MNKPELIQKLEMARDEHYRKNFGYTEGKHDGIVIALEMVYQLTEPTEANTLEPMEVEVALLQKKNDELEESIESHRPGNRKDFGK